MTVVQAVGAMTDGRNENAAMKGENFISLLAGTL